ERFGAPARRGGRRQPPRVVVGVVRHAALGVADAEDVAEGVVRVLPAGADQLAALLGVGDRRPHRRGQVVVHVVLEVPGAAGLVGDGGRAAEGVVGEAGAGAVGEDGFRLVARLVVLVLRLVEHGVPLQDELVIRVVHVLAAVALRVGLGGHVTGAVVFVVGL